MLLGLLLLPTTASAATVTLRLPDSTLQTVLRKFCQWHQCECVASDKAVQQAVEKAIGIVSLGNIKTLAELDAHLRVGWDG